jgi:putative transposase
MRKKYTGKLKAQIVMEMLKEEKTISKIASEYEIYPTQLNNWKAITKERLPEILEDNRKKNDVVEKDQQHQIEELYAEVARLTTQLTWLKKNLESNWSRENRFEWIEPNHPDIPLSTQAELLDISRSSIYYKPALPSPRIVAIWHRIAAVLNKAGLHTCRETVQMHMRSMGIQAIYPGPNLSKRNHEHKIYPYLLRKVSAQY